MSSLSLRPFAPPLYQRHRDVAAQLLCISIRLNFLALYHLDEGSHFKTFTGIGSIIWNAWDLGFSG